MDEDMSMDSEGGLQPAFEQQPRQQGFNAQMSTGDPGRKQLQVAFFLPINTNHTTDH